MEKADQELLFRIAAADTRLKRLYDLHQKLEEEVAKYGRYAPYSSSAAIHEIELKKEKLRTKEMIMTILNEYRHRDGVETVVHH